ncbi:hypothetical protein PVAND_016611 [Polypedilum vanderplanki]|uniref:DUF4758 domain-containing protein n=1 Tax=Polypedilum vanderplanki TaxID=319348 RepID=A0A9J6BG37_POLVA|nr:hypothetical protein PVAND_016611 [Polypedilum vanderplanki]
MRFLQTPFLLLFALIISTNANDDIFVQPTASVQLITQNVYGFADFTTTIGNTVMIFSPSSVPAAPEPPKEIPPTTEETTEQPTTSTIETKPIAETPPEAEIMPSKTIVESSSSSETKEQPQIINSVVQVIEEVPTPATKKPKKKKPKTTTTTANPIPFEVKAITAVTPEPPKVVLPAKPAVNVEKFIVEPVKSVEVIEEDTEEPQHEDDEDEIVLQDGNTISEPEYDFLSRQPTEFIEETYRVVNLKPSVVKKPKTSAKTSNKQNPEVIHPTGLVTKSGGTVINNGVTTVHETSVIGTYISGKYAQVLQSTSSIINNAAKPKISPSSTLRILKTAAPSLNKTPKYVSNEDDLPNDGQPLTRTSRRPGQAPSSFKNRIQNRKDSFVSEEIVTPSPPLSGKKTTSSSRRQNGFGKGKSAQKQTVATVSAEPVTTAYSSRRNKSTRKAFQPSTVQQIVAQTQDAGNRRFKPKISPSQVDSEEQQSTSLYKFKLNRTPGRWQYKTTPKPRVTIRKLGGEIQKDALEVLAVTPSIDGSLGNDIANAKVDLDVDLDGSGSVNGDVLDDANNGAADNRIEKKLPIETIRVEISTPADFSDTYYEIATIKSPYTFQVGANKNTRYITVTSTFEKTLDPEPTATSVLTEPLTENILAPTSHIDKEHNLLETSIATLPALHLNDDQATPPLETVTETFSTTQILLKTHILPVVKEQNTTSYTLIQTYHVTRLVTATKTLPPTDLYQFVPSKTLNEFNSKLDEAGSELHLELEFGDENEHDEEDVVKKVALPEDLDLANIGSDFDLSEVDKLKIKARPKTTKAPAKKKEETTSNPLGLTPEQLAILRLLNPAAVPNVITTSKPIIKVSTVYESHVLPITNGASTFFSTISRPIATVTKTDYELATSVIAPVTPPPINPLLQLQQQQQQFQIQSTPVVAQAIVTETDSKVLKLTFGARTAYTTLYNTRVVPTMVTSYVTQSIPVQASAFPGFYPAPYPPFPFVG